MEQINLVGAVLAAVSAFVLGGLWYSPVLFGRAWMAHAGLSEEKLATANKGRMFGASFVWALLGALVFAAFVGEAEIGPAVGAGVAAGLFWVAGSFGMNYAFEQRSLMLLVINGGYHAVQYTLYGVIIGLMNML